MKKKYKIAVITDSANIEKWKFKIINELQDSEIADISLFVKKPVIKKYSNFLYKWYEKLDRLIFSKTEAFKELAEEENALELMDIYSLQNIKPYFINGKIFIDGFQDNTPFFDIALNLSNERFPENSINTRYGLWFFSFGKETGFTKAPYLMELFNNEPILECSLNAIINNENLKLYSSYSNINPFSLYLSQNKNYWKASNFVLRCLQSLEEKPCKQMSNSVDIKTKEYPSFIYMLIFLLKIGKRFITQKIKNKFLQGQWFIALTEEFQKFNIIVSPKGRFFADPFLVENKDTTYVFFEDYHYKKHKGVISCAEILNNNKISAPKTVLERDYHLSYPFIFKEDDTFYMIPETLGNKTIELYESREFPDDWVFKKNLFDNINAVDTTLLKYNDKYWLFTSIADKAGYLCDELFLFYSNSLFGEWTPHKKNPIVSDVRTARCAGKIFKQNGNLIRPSQETSIRYGYQLNFNKIEILTADDYKETLIKKIRPESLKGNLALHTYNLENRLEVIDGYKFKRKYF